MLKTKKSNRILAINLTTRYLAVAIFEKNHLIYFGIKTIKNKKCLDSLKKVSSIIIDLIYVYQPNLIVQQKAYYVQQKSSEKLKEITLHIKKLIRKLQIDYHEYTPSIVRQKICQDRKSTKTKTFKILATRFPELVVKIHIDKLGNDRYWDQLFNAVALGYYCWMKIKDESS